MENGCCYFGKIKWKRCTKKQRWSSCLRWRSMSHLVLFSLYSYHWDLQMDLKVENMGKRNTCPNIVIASFNTPPSHFKCFVCQSWPLIGSTDDVLLFEKTKILSTNQMISVSPCWLCFPILLKRNKVENTDGFLRCLEWWNEPIFFLSSHRHNSFSVTFETSVKGQWVREDNVQGMYLSTTATPLVSNSM